MKKGKLALLAAASITLVVTLINDNKDNDIEDDTFSNSTKTFEKAEDNK